MSKKFVHPKQHLFYTIYANFPVKLRSKEIVCVIEHKGVDEPMTLQNVKMEVDNNTEIGFKAITQMVNLGII